MKHIELFKDGFDSTVQEKIQPDNYPYVGNDGVSGEIVYTIVPEPNYVTFTAKEDNSSIGLVSLSPYQTLEYSTNTTTWNTFDTTTNISLNNRDKVYIRGILSAYNTQWNYTQFKMSGKIAASGNCNAIWNYQNLDANLKSYCGYRLFYECTSLVQAPELPGTSIYPYCYARMFYGCTALLQAPELPGTHLVNYCYDKMFYGCTSLNYIKCLATNIPTEWLSTLQWTFNVAPTGTFVKHPNMNSWGFGTCDIPEGWTVIDAEL